MRMYIFAIFIAQSVMANPKHELLGVKATALVKEGRLNQAKKLLESHALTPVIHWRLAQIAVLEKRYNDFHKHLEGSLELKLLKNPEIFIALYNVLPEPEQKWLLNKVDGFFESVPESSCPFFELASRKKRANMLILLLKGQPKNREQIMRELLISLPETIAKDELQNHKDFNKVYESLSTADIFKRVDLLLTFGQNDEAQKTLKVLAKRDLSALETCQIKYTDAKILRKQRKYETAKESFAAIALSCPEEIKIKARFMELTLLRMKGDEQVLAKGLKFVSDYPKHSFTDDVLLFMAGIHFDKGRNDEAHAVLDKLIAEYPDGDMINRALFLKAFSFLKLSQIEKSLLNFKKLESISEKDSLDHASAVYWQARLSVYPAVKLANKKKLTKANQKKLETLIMAEQPSVYSWLAYSLLSTLGIKPKVRVNKKSKTPEFLKEKELLVIKNLISEGFKEEAVHLLDDIAVNDDQIKTAASVAMLYGELGMEENGHQKLVRCNKKLAQKLAKEVPDIYRRISYPIAYKNGVDQVLDRIDVPKALVYGIMRQESGFLAESCSWAGAKGLMQLIYSSAQSQSQWWNVKDLEETDLFHGPTNLLLASSLLKNYWQQFGSMAVALCAYNAGPGNAKKWLAKNNGSPLDIYIEEIPFQETNTYVKTVLGSTFAYGTSKTALPHLSLALEQ